MNPAPPHRAGPPPARIALAHDWCCGLRGGERVLDAIARALAPYATLTALYVMFDDRRPLTPAIDALPRVVSGVGAWPLASGPLRRWLLPAYPRAVAQLSRRLAQDHARAPIDALISTSSAAIKGLAPPPGVPHLCYLHAPARYVWSQADAYAGGLRGLGLAAFAQSFRRWDRATSSNVTAFLANSTHTAGLTQACYGRDASVLWPPVRTHWFTPPPEGHARAGGWLVVSALEPYKRVDLAILAANASRSPLTIIGDGSQRAHLARLAGPTVKLLGRRSDEDVRDHLRAAELLVFPQVEDFGIVAAEALACGCPVVARRAGGATDIIEDGLTGALFDSPDVPALLGAVARCPRGNSAACVARAQAFSEARFEREFLAHVQRFTRPPAGEGSGGAAPAPIVPRGAASDAASGPGA